MTKRRIVLAAALAAATAGAAAAQELRIGYINTLSGPGAAVGEEQMNGWRLGLEHEGWGKDGDTLGGVPAKVFYADDQLKPDVGVREAERMLSALKVHLVAGITFSNVLMAVQKPVLDRQIPLLITNAGASPLAGELCNPLVTSTSWNNDQTPEALGHRMSQDRLRSIYLMAPNYQAGKDMLTGLRRTLKGPEVLGETLFKVGESDFQADLSKVRAARPEAVFVFAPGSMGIAFFKQWAASGVGGQIKLYSVFTVDWLTLPAIGDAAIGSYHTMFWNVDLPIAANKRFVEAFLAKHGRNPSHYAAQAYDAPRLLAAALRALGGRFDDAKALARALRKTSYDSVRGPYEYNVNGMPIQNFYLREVVKGADGRPAIVTRGLVFERHKDSYWEKCPPGQRL
jgi:branched-chain amino acid transport system substrate-binding protein